MLPQIELSRVSLPYASGAGAIDEYAVANLRPELVAAFADSYYRASSSLTTFDGLITHSAASNATMVDSDGLLKWRPHNIVLNSATPATQSITVISGADYTVECTGVSIALSGAGTGTVTEGNPATITASTTTLTLTVTGSTGTMWAYRSDLGGMVNNPDRGDSYVPTTSSAVYLPRRGHHVYNGDTWEDKGLLHESEARTNLWTYSSDLSNAAVVKSNATVTNDGDDLGGGSTGSRCTSSSTASSQVYDDITVAAGTTHTFSFYCKNVNATDVSYFVFDLSNSANIVSPTSFFSQIDTDKFSRVSFTFTTPAGCTSVRLGVRSWDNTTDIVLDGLQLEAGSTPSSYIPTSGATVTRAAETLTIPAAKLPWPTPKVIGPELVTNGTFDTDLTGWTKGTGWTISGGQATHSGGTSGGLTQAVSAPIGKVYQVTVDVSEWNGSGVIQVQLYGGGGSDSFQVAVNGSYTRFITTTLNRTTFGVFTASGWDGSIDNISVREIDPLAVSIQMQGRMTYADEDADAQHVFSIWGSGGNRIRQALTTNVGTGRIDFQSAANSVYDFVVTGASYVSPGINVPFNIASRHGSTFINGSVDGTALTADLTPTALPDLSATDLQIAYAYMGTISLLRIWADDLGDTGIAEASA